MKHTVNLILLFCLLTIITKVHSCMQSSGPNGRHLATTPHPDEDEDSGENSGHECGPFHGVCPQNKCCSLHNECGTDIYHCNLSLGCKKKWGVCS